MSPARRGASLRGVARLVVVGDSLTFHGPCGPLPLADERLYPQRTRAGLAASTGRNWDVAVVARAGWGVREMWLALQRDVHLQQQVLLDADAVVIGVGGADSLSVGVPRPVFAMLPFLRPTPLRRSVRRGLDRAHPWLVRATSARMRYTPASVHEHALRKIVPAVRLFAPAAAVVGVVPPLHDAPYYAHLHPHHAETAARTRRLAMELDLALVDIPILMRPWMDRLNPDGVHWPFEVHAAVADALVAELVPRLP